MHVDEHAYICIHVGVIHISGTYIILYAPNGSIYAGVIYQVYMHLRDLCPQDVAMYQWNGDCLCYICR